MKLPDFLIIGAMKAGTTSLYEDLQRMEGVYLPPEKEPNDLINQDAGNQSSIHEYGRKYTQCPEECLAGDASTAYAKLPTYPNVAEKARKILGNDLKVIYMVRHPIHRIKSHYYHQWGLQLENRSMNDAVLEDNTYVDYSRYEWQLAPWIEALGEDNVLVIRFEEYVTNREQTLKQVCKFIGVNAQFPESNRRNASEGKRVVLSGTIFSYIAKSRFYLYWLKPLMSTGARDQIKALLLPKARNLTESMTDQTIAELWSRLSNDAIAASYKEQSLPSNPNFQNTPPNSETVKGAE